MSDAGDKVRIKTKSETFLGTLMPRPPILEGDYVVLKLENGYNIGIEKSKILEIKTEQKYSAPKKPKQEKIKDNPKLPTVSILSFGGTISSKVDYKTGGVIADYTAEDFLAMEPRLRDYANLKARKVMSLMSEDFLPCDWKKMAEETFKELKNSDAVIITQGTDTLHFSTAILSFFLKKLNKPVIFTAAQRSIDRGSSDAFMNLLCAVKAASLFDGAGVFLVMHGSSSDDFCYIHKGTKVRKMHSLRRDAFRSINEFPIAKVFPNKDKIEYIHDNYTKRSKCKPELDASFEEKTALITIYPGMDPGIIDYYLDKEYRGIVLAATALGHVPTSCKKNIMKQLDRAKKENVPVVVATQCLYGRVDPLVYSPLRKLSIERDVVFAEDMLPEVAYLKLGWILSKTNSSEKVKEMMLTNYSGEINRNQDPRAFLT
ncbi:MAG: Glu-tRNA(Gln) amidotransferase subunit GatD [Candidatus Woesearchaeota archaeon]